MNYNFISHKPDPQIEALCDEINAICDKCLEKKDDYCTSCINPVVKLKSMAIQARMILKNE